MERGKGRHAIREHAATPRVLEGLARTCAPTWLVCFDVIMILSPGLAFPLDP